MPKILMFYSAYGYNYPQGKDVMNLSRYFAKNSLADVFVLSQNGNIERLYDDVEEKIHFYSLKSYNQLFEENVQKSRNKNIIKKVWYKAKRMILEKRYAKDSFRNIVPFFEVKKFARKHRKDKYEALISFSNPFYVQKYADYLFSHMNIRKWIPYVLDPHADNCRCNNREIAIREEQKMFEKAFRVFTFKDFVDTRIFSPCLDYLDKIRFVPVHIMVDNCQNERVIREDNDVRMCFCGQLIDDIRSPERLLKTFELLPDNFYLQFYSSGCEKQIDFYSKKLDGRIRRDGFIVKSFEYAQELKNYDILVSIGNTIENQIPSKIYDYCSYGKPIIHLSNIEKDPVKLILRDYPLVLFIDSKDDFEISANKIRLFTQSSLKKRVPFETVREIFDDCLVDTIGNKILKEV